MVAKQKILPGDVLVVEPAFSTSLFRDFYSTNCLHCFQRLPEEPVCCPGCTTVSSYCFRTLEKVSSHDLKVALYVKTLKSSCITVGRVAHSYHTVSRSGAKLDPQFFRCCGLLWLRVRFLWDNHYHHISLSFTYNSMLPTDLSPPPDRTWARTASGAR